MTQTKGHPNKQKTTKFLSDLQKQLWKQEGEYELRPNMSNAVWKVPRIVKIRDLTKEEFEQILEALSDSFLISITSSNFGFSFSFIIWSEPHTPFMRREPRFKPTQLLVFESRQVPSSALPSGKDKHDDKVFAFMEPYFNNPNNLKKLKKFHLEIPRKRSFYEY